MFCSVLKICVFNYVQFRKFWINWIKNSTFAKIFRKFKKVHVSNEHNSRFYETERANFKFKGLISFKMTIKLISIFRKWTQTTRNQLNRRFNWSKRFTKKWSTAESSSQQLLQKEKRKLSALEIWQRLWFSQRAIQTLLLALKRVRKRL